MKVYTYSQARQHLSEILDQAKYEVVIIRRRDGSTFSVISKQLNRSPFDVRGMKTQASTEDIISAVRESRQR